MSKIVTKLQNKFLNAVYDGCNTFTALQNHTGIKGRSEIVRIIMALKERGYVDKQPGKHRSIVMTEFGLEYLSKRNACGVNK